MPSATFQLSPDPADATISTHNLISPDSLLRTTGPQNNLAGSLQLIGKGDIRRGTLHRFDCDIPAGAQILSAYIRLLPQASSATDCTNIACALAAKDGLWDLDGGTGKTFGRPATDSDFESYVFDTGLTQQIGVVATTNAFNVSYGEVIAPRVAARVRGGQLYAPAPGAFNLGRIQFRMLRSGSLPSANLFCDLYNWTTGGGIDEGTGVLATSDAVAFDSLPTAGNALINFNFSGGNQYAVSNAERLAAVVRCDTLLDSFHLMFMVGSSSDYPSGGHFVFGDLTEAFGTCLYPEMGMFPILYEIDDTTIRTPPHGGISIIPSVPNFTNNVWVQVNIPDFTDRIQEWVSAAGYTEGDKLGLILQPTASSSLSVPARSWDGAELFVEWALFPAPAINFDLAVRPSGLVVPVAEVNCDADLPDADLEVEVPSANQTTSLAAADVPLALPSTNILLEAPTMAELLNLCPLDVDICVTRGDTRPFTFTLQLAGVPINITGSTFVLSIDTQPEPPDATTLVLALTGTLITPASGIVGFQFSTANWTGPPAIGPGDYFFDLQWTDSTGAITTAAKGGFEIKQDISK